MNSNPTRGRIRSAALAAMGCILALSALAGTVTFTYDSAGRVTGADYGLGRVITYTYNAGGNLVERRTSGTNAAPTVDVGVTKSDAPDPVSAPDSLVYFLMVSNNGPNVATGVMLTDALPLKISYDDIQYSQGSADVSGRAVTWDVGILAPGAVAEAEIITLALGSGTITNVAVTAVNEPDTNALNDTDFEVTTLDPADDTDGDGLPDWWEEQFFGGPTNGIPTEDDDTDGLDNEGEFQADTDPTDPDNLLYVADIDIVGTNVMVSLEGGIESVLYLEKKVDIGATSVVWSAVFTNLPPTSASNDILDPIGTNTTGFYRARAVRP